VADIPPHLLERSRARRAALGQGGDAPAESAAPAAAAKAAPSTEVATTSAAPVSASSGSAGGPPPREVAPPVVAGPPPPPPGLATAKMGRIALMSLFPVWLLFMWGNFVNDSGGALTPLQEGQALYTANCVACHGANGAGSDAGLSGRPLWKGQAELTFLAVEDQMAFVRHGSCGVGVPYGNPEREGGQHQGKGGMPAFAEAALSDEELRWLIMYERTILSKGETAFVEEEVAAVEAGEAPPTIPPLTANVCK
jgi:mono/diheme cytochrome c family protein